MERRKNVLIFLNKLNIYIALMSYTHVDTSTKVSTSQKYSKEITTVPVIEP
jgi:hypothetical protein